MITIVDYGMGNLASVFNAIRNYTEHVYVSSDAKSIKDADKLILPGVGAFKDAYCEIEKRGLRENILEFILSGRPFLGICLGLQLLFTRSYEGGESKGFGIIKGDVVPFIAGKGLKVPHMGWNQVTQNSSLGIRLGTPHQGTPSKGEGQRIPRHPPRDPSPRDPEQGRGATQKFPLFKDVQDGVHMYFVHSYYVIPEDESFIAATTDYGSRFCSMIHKDNIYAMQFHPEKSQEQGLKIIENFVHLR